MSQFTCEHCHRRLTVADTHAGKEARCPHCGRPVPVPERGPPDAGEHVDKPETPQKWSAQDAALLDIAHLPSGPPAGRGQTVPPEGGTPADGQKQKQPTGTGNLEVVEEAPVPFLYALAYPANLDGLIQIAVFVLGLWLMNAFTALLGVLAGPYGALLSVIGQVIVLGYIVYYAGYCIYDSAQGGRHAPAISPAHLVDLGELLSQLLLLVAAVALCFWPAAVYRGVTGRSDAWFWILGATGAFFLPMTLLTAALFDGIDALNPLLILRSILTTLPAYLALLVELGVPGGVWLAVRPVLAGTPMAHVLAPVAYLYLLLVGAHLLGRFYRQHQDRLQWGL
jgi:DNA-directed RNA polymerase subunit RPC12/RpoP